MKKYILSLFFLISCVLNTYAHTEKQQQENNRTVGSATGADAATVLKQLEQLNAVEVITANKESAAMKIQRLQEQNEFLVNELDYTLSEINLSTYIDIDADIK